ncbi:hypothetical protein CR513_49453, partial [Mucuna pruriens]
MEYKVERVLIDQGSSANILYWLTFQKLGLLVEIKRVIELDTTFRIGGNAQSIVVQYTVVDTWASYNRCLCLVLGQHAKHRPKLHMPSLVHNSKFPIDYTAKTEVGGRKVEGSQRGNQYVTAGKIYQRGTVSHVACQRGHGKEASGKWRMCTDYIDLNKAYPKDPYALSNID